MSSSKTVAVVGAGYSGIRIALNLTRTESLRRRLDVILVDRNPYHQYIHLLHEVAAGIRPPERAQVPLSRLFRGRKVEFVQGDVQRIDPLSKVVTTDQGRIECDILVVALGSETAYYGIEGLKEHSLPLKSVDDAVRINEKVTQILNNPSSSGEAGAIVVGGGGFTGVEVAGEFAHLLRERGTGSNPPSAGVILIEAMQTVLPGWDPTLARRASEHLTALGVKLITGLCVTRASRENVALMEDLQVYASTIVWTGGVQVPNVVQDAAFKTGRGGRVVIDGFCQAEGFPDAYVVGDCALILDQTGNPLPQNVQLAHQTADVATANILASLDGGKRRRLIPKFRGEFVSIGGYYEGFVKGIRLSGLSAKLFKKAIHYGHTFQIGGFSLFKDELLSGSKARQKSEYE